MLKAFFLCLIFNLGLISHFAFGQMDPNIEWRVLETDHFEMVYPKELKAIAEEYIYHAEKSHQDLKPLFGEMAEKTIIVLADNTDQANGYANFLPYPHIVVFPSLPDELSSIGHYGSWARDLMIHEYTHILSFKPSHSFYTPLRWIFGTIVRPNAILPRWFLEGVAVQVESRFTKFGRLNAPGTSAALRALVKEDRLGTFSLDQINESSIPSYPWGRRPYLFGSLLWQSVINEAGLKSVKALHQSYSRRLPFLLDTPVEELTGKGYTELLYKIYGQIYDLSNRQMSMIRSQGEMKAEYVIATEVQSQQIPKISPDGRHLAYTASAPFEGRTIQLLSKPDNASGHFYEQKPKFILSARGTSRFCWSQDSQKFIFNQNEQRSRFHSSSDLFVYHLDKKESKRLTTDERAREGCFSPDGQTVVYVAVRGGDTIIKTIDISGKNIQTVFEPKPNERVSSPQFLKQNLLMFVIKGNNGENGLYTFEIESKKITRRLPQFQDIIQPTMTAKGLVFTSSKTGVPNVYFSKPPFRSAKALTNTETGMWSADLDPETNNLYATESSAQGTRMVVVKKPKYMNPPKLNSVVPGEIDAEGQELSQLQKEDLKIEDSSFWGIEYLLPKYWIPFFFPIPGGAIFQGSVTGTDPVGVNTYFVDLSYDTVTAKTSYGLSYINRSTPVDWTISYSEFQDFLPSIGTTFTNRFASTTFGFQIPWASFRWRGILGARYRDAVEPQADETFQTLKGAGPTAGISYASGNDSSNATQQFPGRTSFSLFHTEFVEQDQFYQFGQTRFSLGQAWSSFLPPRHSLVFQAKGSYAPEMLLSDIITLGDRTLAGNFLVNIINSSFIMRGYPSGAFVGRQLYNTNMEYRFPLLDINKGKSYFPLFLQSISGSWFVDGVSVDGAYFDPDAGYIRSKVEDTYWSTGFEFHLNSTLAYHLPFSTTLGLYYGFSPEAGGGFTPFITFGYSGHGGVGGPQRPNPMR